MSHFRPATESDLDAIVEIMRSYYAEDRYCFVEKDARLVTLELIRDKSIGCLWVADDSGRVVGYLAVTLGFSLEYRGRDASVDELFVEPASRGRGLGLEALKTADEYCRELGVNALHLEVERHRTPALELYRRFGFVDHERNLMTKRLNGLAR